MARNDLTAQRLRELLHYDPETGIFTRKKWMGGTSRVGTVAGTATTGGYIHMGVAGTTYKAHRLAWLYVHGVWPTNDIDHINGITNDNRIANLRDVTRAMNLQNRHASRKGREGLLGASWQKNANKWAAHIKGPNGKSMYLGLFERQEDAHTAYVTAKRRLHPGCTI